MGFAPTPEESGYYTNGEVELRIDHYTQPLHNKYFLKLGVAYLPFSEEEFIQLREIMREYEKEDDEIYGGKKRSNFSEYFLIYIFLAVLLALVAFMVIV